MFCPFLSFRTLSKQISILTVWKGFKELRCFIGWDINLFLDESKILQYFGNVRHNSSALDAFVEVVVVSNNTGLQDAELAWYSLKATYWIGLDEAYPQNPQFRTTWYGLITEVLATRLKIHIPSDYCTVINCAFTFWPTNVFGCFCSFINQFKFVKRKFLD